ncbi:hypothetical protein [Pseudomonas protegens]|uniref:hypothetical protein n=1 Tax=Pseudomonas protegens TaxID=380021 RepID=UPI001C69ADAA|nr:hypothetical protein [Pseudomonas protegens]QYN03712.1 hypothetical protein K1T36_11390 [Pseudomonas protegens]
MRILMAAAAVVVAGCSNTPISADKADPLPLNRIYAFTQKSDSELVVTRDSGMYQVGLKIKLYVDGTLAAEFGQGEVGRFSLTQGPHILAVSDGSVLVESEIELLPGQTMRRRISITMQGIELSPTAI